MQQAINSLTTGTPKSSKTQMAQDLETVKREGPSDRMGLHATWVIQSTLTRGIGLMDNLMGLAVLLDAVQDPTRRTGVSTNVLARSALDAGLAIAYHLDKTLEVRLLRAYASHLGDLQQVFLANGTMPFAASNELEDLASLYRTLHDGATDLGYALKTDPKKTTCERPRVISVVDPSIPDKHARSAQAEPNTTNHAKTFGTPVAEHQWRTASGATHGRIWALLPTQTQLENGTHDGLVYFTAAMTAWEGVRASTYALTDYTGHSETARNLDRAVQAFLRHMERGPATF